MLIRHLYVLMLMTKPYLQECLFESIELIRGDSGIVQMKIVGKQG
jgi:hypothetical protein